MQRLSWYRNRLAAMSTGEIVWRARNCVRDVFDRAYFRLVRHQSKRAVCNGHGAIDTEPCFEALVGWQIDRVTPDEVAISPSAKVALNNEAKSLLADRIRLFGEQVVELGPQVDWNRDYVLSRRAPMTFAPAIDYRDVQVAGDCKRIWELNRHHHLVVLARAYRATGDDRFARQVAVHLESWLVGCPFGKGINWRSPLELAIRLINWCWALMLVRPADPVPIELNKRIIKSAQLHLWEIARKFSRYSSANNHLIGEAAGAFIGATCFSGFDQAIEIANASRRILESEMMRQTGEDGVHRELAFGYHLFVLQFFLLAGLCGRNAGRDFSAAYWRRMERMFEFVAAWCEGGGNPPMFGDSDDGYVLDLGGGRGSAKSLLSVASVLFDRADFAALSAGFEEPIYWLWGPKGIERSDTLLQQSSPRPLSSRTFADAGLYLLQCGCPDQDDDLAVTFDAGPLGFGSLAAHGHADALSITLRAYGVDFLVDPGTYDYFTDPVMRAYFRSTRAHNTIEIDGQDQSEMTGPFLWGRRASILDPSWSVDGPMTRVSAGHDGYRGLAEPVEHHRTVTLDSLRREVTILDRISANDRHWLRIHYHFSEQCQVEAIAPNRYRATRKEGAIELKLDSRASVSIALGDTAPVLGWVSRAYQQKRPSPTLSAILETAGSVCLATRIWIPGRGTASDVSA